MSLIDLKYQQYLKNHLYHFRHHLNQQYPLNLMYLKNQKSLKKLLLKMHLKNPQYLKNQLHLLKYHLNL
jgi:hypothetical protein